MKIFHHDLEVELDHTWWTEAGMKDLAPKSQAYRFDSDATNGNKVLEVRIEEIRPVKRNPGIGIFNDNKEASAKNRVVSILRGFSSDTALPPVKVVPEPASSDFRYKLVAGTHRLYCSLAAGFSHVPTVEGYDNNADH